MPDYFVHPMALCESTNIGSGTRVWAFAHVLPKATIGSDCNICDHVFIENDVLVGNRVTVKCGVQLWDGVQLEDDVFVGPNVTFTNDRFPRSKQYPEQFARTLVKAGASIGANATILPGITIGRNAMIGAGSVVTRDVPPNAIVRGNPARIAAYANAFDDAATPEASKPSRPVHVEGVAWLRLPTHVDMRGALIACEFSKELPFEPRRVFLVHSVPTENVRGEHAHRECHQVLFCLKGSVRVLADDGQNRQEFLLDQPSLGLHLPPMTWGTQFRYSADSTLLVFASHEYSATDYIRTYEKFLDERRAARTGRGDGH
jgi:UDP-2-acetamido-3-amino-2,3-dideoxy-glucuronate N-acetyltransferase